MSKPSEEELNIALKIAEQMRDKESDPFFIAKALLSHSCRIKYLEEIFTLLTGTLIMACLIRSAHI